MSTVRHIEMHSPIAAARSPRPGMSRRGRRLRYVRLHRASADRIFVTPMTRAASRSFQWHGRRSRLSVYTKPRRLRSSSRASRRRATRRRRSATLQICPLRIARAKNSAESKQLSFKVVLERTARNAVFEEGNQREETKQGKKKGEKIARKSRLDISVAAWLVYMNARVTVCVLVSGLT